MTTLCKVHDFQFFNKLNNNNNNSSGIFSFNAYQGFDRESAHVAFRLFVDELALPSIQSWFKSKPQKTNKNVHLKTSKNLKVDTEADNYQWNTITDTGVIIFWQDHIFQSVREEHTLTIFHAETYIRASQVIQFDASRQASFNHQCHAQIKKASVPIWMCRQINKKKKRFAVGNPVEK